MRRKIVIGSLIVLLLVLAIANLHISEKKIEIKPGEKFLSIDEITPCPGGYHTRSTGYTIAAATCTTRAISMSTCGKCGVQYEEEIGEPLGHNWNMEEYVEYIEPTCTEEGKVSRQCTRCSVIGWSTLSANGHSYELIEKLSATCKEEGWEKYECSVCGDISQIYIEINPNAHKVRYIIVDEAVAPTCTETGLTEGKHCSACKQVLTKQEVIDALGHKYTNYVSNNDATCIADGTKTAICDNGCGESETIIYEGSVLGHTEVIDAAIEPTCTATGLTEGSFCSVCNTVLIAQEIIPVTAHDYGEWVIEKLATYEEDGLKYRVCTICNSERQEEIIPKLTNEEFEVSTELNTKEKDGKTYILMITPTTTQELLNNITSNRELEIVDKNGNILQNGANIGTGAKVLQKETKEEVYTLVVYGDITGDGKISIAELAVASKMAVNSPIGINSIQFMALDVSGDGKMTISDLAALSRLMTKQLFG